MRWPPATVDGSRPLIPDTFMLEAYAGRWRSRGAARRRTIGSGAYLLRHRHADRGRHAGGGARGRGRGAHRGRAGGRRRAAGLWPVPASGPPCRAPACSAATASSTTRRSSPSGCGARPGARGSRSWTSTTTTATARSRSSASAATCCYVSLHADPGARYPYFSGFAAETRRGRRRGRHAQPARSPPAPTSDATLAGARPGLEAIGAFGARRRSSCRSASTPFERDPIGDLALRDRRTTSGSAARRPRWACPTVVAAGGRLRRRRHRRQARMSFLRGLRGEPAGG